MLANPYKEELVVLVNVRMDILNMVKPVLKYQIMLTPQKIHGNVNQVMSNQETLVRKNLNLKKRLFQKKYFKLHQVQVLLYQEQDI